MDGYLRHLMFLIGLLLAGIANAARFDVLVVVNENSADSVQLGEYYAAQRDVDPSRIVRIRMPNQFFITWTEFQSLRDQILRFGICPALEVEVRPPACDNPAAALYTAETIAALTASTPLRYIVLTRGVPTRMRVDGSQLPYPNEPTSVDNYLRFWLARHLTQDVNLNFAERSNALNIQSLGEWRRTFRPVNPPLDAEYIIGRIDGLDLTAAKSLVDRTLAAESIGPYGKVHTNQSQVYPWRYAFGLFDEARPECADDSQSTHYLNYAQHTAQGKTPTHCTVKAVKSAAGVNEHMPGVAASRQPLVDDAVVYFGHLDDQTAQGGFQTLLNWRKTPSCTVTLCSAAADPAACRAQSTDPFREINTDCVGVAPGFMGFNFQSYPVANFGSWPTGWEPTTTNENDVPRVDETRGADDSFSAWFDKADETAAPLCYPYAGGILGTTPVACRAKTYIGMQQSLPVAGIDPAAPSPLQLSFRVLGEGLAAAASVRAAVHFYFQVPTSGSCPAGTTPSPATAPTDCIYTSNNSFTVSNGSAWGTQSFTVTPVAVAGSPQLKRILLQFVGNPHVGRIGFDAISVRNQANAELVRNGSFGGGHLQASLGDYAANFLSRLGGLAFWGSASHHQSGGSSFADNAVRSLAFLTRGLPLGDAVWLGETRNSGVLYGDPLYSPTSIRFFALTSDRDSRVSTGTMLWTNSIYGRDLGSRHIRISVCRGGDLYDDPQSAGTLQCDRNGGWHVLPDSEATVDGGGRQRYILLPEEPAFTQFGDYTLRLQVTRINPATGIAQTLDDYYPIKYRYSDAELAAYSIVGRVLTDGGDPHVEVTMTASSNGVPVRSVGTDLDGRFDLYSLPAGTYQVAAAASGCVLSPVNATLPVTLTNQGARIDFRCVRVASGTLSGKTRDAADKAIANALVNIAQVGGGATRSTYTSSTGYYQVGGLPPGTYSVTADQTGWSFASRQVVVDASNPASLDLLGVSAPGKVSGDVRDASGQPIVGAEVYGVASDGTDGFWTVTNSEGYFEQGGLLATAYLINAFSPQFNSLPADMLVQRDAAPVAITLGHAAQHRSIMGFVVINGVAVQSAVVTLRMPDGTEVTAVTPTSGFYRFDNLRDGTYQVHAHGYGRSYGQRTVTISHGNAVNVDFPAY